MTLIQETSFGIIPLHLSEEGWKTLIICHTLGGHWAFPKGRQEVGEMALETARRELFEETGLSIETVLSQDSFIEQYELIRDTRVLKTVHYFPAVVKGELKLQEEEVSHAKWVLLKEAPQLLTFQKTTDTYLTVLSHLQHILG
ncbi:NUDIX domain-containing protein [Rhabdochlamydiaceae symbiont of Dictyostelium giganteum]|uniref:NUDIX domain-containing protein n=1 Tax=Rhabdochlamydiaceae symbiont of Dictyostelium giganteum TaxID=3342349 RepID=UPI00384E61A1